MKIVFGRSIGAAIIVAGLALAGREVVASPVLDHIAASVSQTDYHRYVDYLVSFGTRVYGSTSNVNAGGYIYQEFADFGLSTSYHDFTYGDNTYHNVVGQKTGVKDPNKIFIVGAHFDTVDGTVGADDNTSGTAGVLEIASVLSQLTFDYTVKFIAFNLEELGLLGSKAYATYAKTQSGQITGMLNLDMIGYTGDINGDLELFGDNSLVDMMATFAASYMTDLPVEKHYGNVYGSDHYYFHSSQYLGSTSLLAIEDTPDEIWNRSNPYYHKPTDTVDKLNFNFASQVTRLTALTLANLAGVQDIPEPSVLVLMIMGLLMGLGWNRTNQSAMHTWERGCPARGS